MAEPPDVGIFSQLLEKAWLIIGALLGLVWRDHNTKLTETAEKLDEKADKDDLAKALTHIEKLFNNAESDREKTRDRFDKTMAMMVDMRKDIIGEVRRGNGN